MTEEDYRKAKYTLVTLSTFLVFLLTMGVLGYYISAIATAIYNLV
jgi:hypothetical protein